MNDETAVIPPVIKPKRKYTRRKNRMRSVRVPSILQPAEGPTEPQEFIGLTTTDCCKGCGPTGCVISGSPICGHPNKGAQINRSDPDAVERLKRARKYLGISAVENRYA